MEEMRARMGRRGCTTAPALEILWPQGPQTQSTEKNPGSSAQWTWVVAPIPTCTPKTPRHHNLKTEDLNSRPNSWLALSWASGASSSCWGLCSLYQIQHLLCAKLYTGPWRFRKKKKIEHSSYPSRDHILMTEAVVQLPHMEIVIVIIVWTEWSWCVRPCAKGFPCLIFSMPFPCLHLLNDPLVVSAALVCRWGNWVTKRWRTQ